MFKTMPLVMLGQKSGCPMQSMPPTETATKITTTKDRTEVDVKVKEQADIHDAHAIKQRSRRQVPSGERTYHVYVIAA